jgi:peptidoglycan hydrolase-like protein with peptidoglycan-binding domain
MIVDDKDLHRKDRLQVAASLLGAEVYLGPGTKAWGRTVAMSLPQYFRMIQGGGRNAHNRCLNIPGRWPTRRTTMAKPSKSEYIRWVKGSLNRLLNASLADDGTALLEYRSWLITFQMRHTLAVNAKVDRPTQDALIKANRKHAGYVRWIQNALLISGEGIKVGGKNILADGSWGPHTEQAVKAFQAKHEKVKADGWVGANTERLLMLRTGTVPPGRTKVLREPKFDPVVPIWDVPVPDDDYDIPPAEGFRFATSEGIGLSASLFGISSGTIYLDDLSNNTRIALSYASLGLGKSSVPGGYDYSNLDMECTGEVYPNPIYGRVEVTSLNDIIGWCLIYQAQYVGLQGRYVTRMFLSMGEGLVYGSIASLTGVGALVAPVLMIRSCKAIVAIRGISGGSPNAALSGAIGYLSLGDAKAHIDKLRSLIPV